MMATMSVGDRNLSVPLYSMVPLLYMWSIVDRNVVM